MNRRRAYAVIVTPLLAAAGAACASLAASSGADQAGAASVLERLYFGRAIGDTGQVSDSAWRAFLAEEVTPRFPRGFTVTRAEGQWRGAAGVVQRESTYVLDLVRPREAAAGAAVDTVVAAYRRRFGQEAVLRLTAELRARF